MKKPPMSFTIIESGDDSRNKEIEIFGQFGAAIYQGQMFRVMSFMADGEYNGGIWDMRLYENGAVGWFFPNDRTFNVKTFNGFEVIASFEAVSFAANLIVMSALTGSIAGEQSQETAKKVVENYELLVDAAMRSDEWVSIRQIID